MTPEAERFNGWAAMLGFVAAVGAYVTTGQIIPIFLEMTVVPQNCVIKFWLYVFRQLKEVLISISSSL